MKALPVLALWCAAGAARAFVCTQVPGASYTVFWETRQVTVLQHERCSDDVPDNAACHAALTASMKTWTDVACTDFTFIDGGNTTVERAGYDWRHPEVNTNIIVFREGRADDPWDTWEHQAGALAITTVTFNSQTGRILDADIEVNGVPRSGGRQYVFAVCNPDGTGCEGANDIQNTITHELGHVAGLDHVTDPNACMYASATPSETRKRRLAPDDEAGLCAIYPPGLPATPCTPAGTGGINPRIRELRSCDATSGSPCDRPTFLGITLGCQSAPPSLPAFALLTWLWRKRAR